MRYTLALLILALVAGCSSSRLTTKQVEALQADCSNVDQTIEMLNKQKDGTARRVKSGLQSVVPFSAAVNVVTGNYKENVEVATGKRDKQIDEKVKALETLKASCPTTTAAAATTAK